MEAGARGDIEHALLAPRLEYIDEEAAFTFGALVPIDEFVPLVYEPSNILCRIFIRLPNFGGVRPVILCLLWCKNDRSSPFLLK